MSKIVFGLLLSFLLSVSCFSQWLPVGPKGGYVNDLVDFDSVLFVAAGGSGIYKSTDEGISWAKCENGPESNILVAQNDTLLAVSLFDWVEFSTDLGETWTETSGNISDVQLRTLHVDDISLYAGGSEGGLFYSKDRGTTWIESDDLSGVFINDFGNFNDRVYAVSDVLYESEDYGVTWTSVPLNGINPFVVRQIDFHRGAVFISYNSLLYVSRDTFDTWAETKFSNSIERIRTFGDSLFVVTLDSIYLSTDIGESWTKFNGAPTSTRIRDLLPKEDRILVSTVEGLFASPDGGQSWSPSNGGFNGHEVTSFEIFEDNLYAGTIRGGIYRMEASGSWTQVSSGLSRNAKEVQDIMGFGVELFVGTKQGLFSSSNQGASWSTRIVPGFSLVSELDSDQGVIVASLPFQGLFLSLDTAQTWEKTADLGVSDPFLNSIEIKNDTLLAAAPSGEVLASTDRGVSWTDISIDGAVGFELELNDGLLMAGTSKGLFQSNDLGNTWEQLGDLSTSVRSFAVVNDTIFANTGFGFLFYTIADNEWTFSQDESPGGSLAIVAFDESIFVGSLYSSVWRLPRATFGEVPLSTQFLIERRRDNPDIKVYPNPTSTTAYISWNSINTSNVSIELFSLEGRRWWAQSYQVKDGSLNLEIDLSDLNSGIFILKLTTGKEQFYKRLMIR